MSYGLQIFNAAGTLTFDNNTATGGVVAEVFQPQLSGGVYPSVVKTYPAFAGRTAQVLTLDGAQAFQASVDYALGYPRVTTTQTYWPVTYMVLVL